MGQIIDVSMGGLAFRYVGTEEPSNGELSIFLAERDFYVGQIPFRTVSDFEIAGKTSSTSVTLRRSGVQFGKLTDHQTSQMEHFYVYRPGSRRSETLARLNTNLYNRETEKLIWTASSEIVDPKSVKDVVGTLSNLLVRDLRDKKLIK
ncbi:MAG: hypothetical protein JRI70_08495 [Deltaproteobacteria bacterium]|nr:hypothetical protein [Deltaproteobacteria bacterium]